MQGEREGGVRMDGQREAAAKVERMKRRVVGAAVPRSGTWLVRSCSKKLELFCPARAASVVPPPHTHRDHPHHHHEQNRGPA
jgi:hypothetical protein